jgi:EmrB/QacA subfamily drug resistance transporter
MTARRTALWTFVVTALALFMTALDNLVVTTALPVIKADLGASLAQLEWTVNAYTLAFAVLLLTGAALGDRFGRKRVFLVGLTIFTSGSAAAALAPTGDLLVIARAIQGIGAAIVTPLTLTLLSAAVPPERRGLALGAWGGISGLAIAIGPVVGGAIISGLNWHWIFWLNVPLGIVVLVMASLRLSESRGPVTRLDLPGLVLASSGLFALVWALIHGNGEGWTSTGIVAAFAAAAVLLIGFVIREARTSEPMLPLRFFESRQFATVNLVSFVMSFGIFGSIFLLAQFFQIVQRYTPLEAGIRTLPWTGMPIIVAPLAGLALSRVRGRTLLAAGMALMGLGLAWIAAVATPTVEYPRLVPAFVLAGTGMSLFFAPTASLVLGAVRRAEEGQASGANNAIREIGGVFGVAILASVFSAAGGYASPQAFVNGLVPAVWLGAAVLGIGTLVALAIPANRHVEVEIHAGSPGAEALEGRGGNTLTPEPVHIRS